MTARELIGFLLLIAGAALVPLGWIVSHKILLLAVALLALGVSLFYTERMLKREERLSGEGAAGDSCRHVVPGDLHNATGWQTGGRTQPFESGHSESGGDAD
jgi:hypothetical protein